MIPRYTRASRYLHGSTRDTFPIDLGCFNSLDVLNLGTINVYNDIDDGDDSKEEFSLSSTTSEDEASVFSFESYSDEGSFLVSMDVHSDQEASSIGVSPVDSVDNSAENHVSLRKKVKDRICSFFKTAWNAFKHPSPCRETNMEPFVPPPDDPEPGSADSSRSTEASYFQPADESDKFGYELGIAASEGFSTENEETSSSTSIWSTDVDCVDEDSLSSDTSEDDCGVVGFSPISIQRRNPVHGLDQCSFGSANNHFICEGGRDNRLDLLSISSDLSSTDGRSGAWQNGPARETCSWFHCMNMYTTDSSRSLEEPSVEEPPSVYSVENSTVKHPSLRKKMKKGISSFFKKAWKPLKWPSFCCDDTRVEPFVPPQVDSDPDPEPDDPKPHFITEPFGFKPADDFQPFNYEMVMIASGGFGFL